MTVLKRFIEQNYFLIIVFALILLFKIVMLPYWTVYGDSFYYILTYKYSFHDVESMALSLNFYLANLIGGAFLHIWQGAELYGLRFFQIFNDLILLIGVCKLYDKLIKSRIVLLGLLIPVVCFYYRPMEFYYDSLSVTFAVWILYFFVKGFENFSYTKVVISGFLVGINILMIIRNIPKCIIFAIEKIIVK
ncbi:MAG: hypothetical protein J5676_04975 [Bacteroidaceae bacterium]|nr:hypothetical protein [Bacteroidaceae bacterium]